jgi:excisionase family DNA binding protein
MNYMEADMEDKALTTKEIAEYLNISNQMVYNMIKADMIPAFKVGNAVRILSSDLQKYTERQKAVFQNETTNYSNPDPGTFSLQNIYSHFDAFSLSRISFSFPLGTTFSVLGPSGSGKTLLLKTIAGLVKPDTGAIFHGPSRLDTLAASGRRLGFVFQDHKLFPHMSSAANIGFPYTIRKLEKSKIDEAVAKTAEELQINREYLPKTPDKLPEGIKQLVAIGHAQANAIDTYIMDEPLSHLDPTIKMDMRVFLKLLVQKMGKTTIFAFNDPSDALALSDYIAILDQGQLIQFGHRDEVYQNPVSPVALEVLSLNGTVRLPVEIKNGRTVPFDLPQAREDGYYSLYFRPDEVRYSSGPAKAGEIPVKVISQKFLDGSRVYARCMLDEKNTVDLILPADSGGSGSISIIHAYVFKA